MYKPRIYEEEILYSYIERISRLNLSSTERTIAMLLYGEKKHRFNVHYDSNLINLIERIYPHINDKKEQSFLIQNILKRHTLFPLYCAMNLQEKNAELYDGFTQSGNIAHKINLFNRSNKQMRNDVKVCPLCFQADYKKFGESYLRRVHQIPSNKYCHVHNVKLVEISILNEFPQRLLNINLSEISSIDVDNIDPLVFEYHKKFVSVLLSILNNDQIISLEEVMNKILSKVKECGNIGTYSEIQFQEHLFKSVPVKVIKEYSDILLNKKLRRYIESPKINRKFSLLEFSIIIYCLFETGEKFLAYVAKEEYWSKQREYYLSERSYKLDRQSAQEARQAREKLKAKRMAIKRKPINSHIAKSIGIKSKIISCTETD